MGGLTFLDTALRHPPHLASRFSTAEHRGEREAGEVTRKTKQHELPYCGGFYVIESFISQLP